MTLVELKPLATALLLPPAGPLLLGLLGVAMAAGRRRAFGLLLAALALGSLWFLSCNAVAVQLAARLLPPVEAVTPQALTGAQAIVVLGGGIRPEAPEYGAAQPAPHTLGRLRYGATLARRTQLPLAFAGGVGWSNTGTGTATEAEAARRMLQQDYGLELRWVDERSRDTGENAARVAELLLPQGVRRIALVTDSWHMERALRMFQSAGFDVVAAPTGFIGAYERPLLEWLPSAHGLAASRQVLREWLALRVAGYAAAASHG